MAELADALDLGSSVLYVGVQVPLPAPIKLIHYYLSQSFELYFFLQNSIIKKVYNFLCVIKKAIMDTIIMNKLNMNHAVVAQW